VVEVEVDPGDRLDHVPKIWIAHDIGRALNPVLARGQVEGSVYMGLGEALMEEQAFRRLPPKLSSALVHKIPSMLEYKSLTSLDMPEVETILVEDPDPNCPFGAKEVGQGPLLPVMPAVANAIYDAVGVRIDELPITPDKVLRALELKKRRQAGACRPGGVSPVPYPKRDLRAAALGRRRRQCEEGCRETEAQGRRRMMRLPWFEHRAPRSVAEAVRILAGEGPHAMPIAGGTDLIAQHEAPPSGTEGARVAAEDRSIAGERRGARRRADAYADHPQARIAARPAPGGAPGGDRASAQHGHDRRQPVPRYPLQLLQPELRVAQGHRLLPEEGGRRLLGGDREQALRGRLLHRLRARADRARRYGQARVGVRRAQRRRSRISTTTTASTTSSGGRTRS
jgi:hypothetical protein